MDTGVIYARFSSQSQNEQSIEAQIRICGEFAENKGIKIVNTYSDKAKSGTNDHRPAFQKMISDAQTGAFKYIIEGTLYTIDGEKFKPVAVKPKTTQKSTYTPTSTAKPKPQNLQFSIFDRLDETDVKDTVNDTSTAESDTKDDDSDMPTEEEMQEAMQIVAEEESQQTKSSPVKEQPKGNQTYRDYMLYQSERPTAVIALRLGDFYEVLGDNAVTLGNELELTITSRDVGLESRIPMIGFPYHAAENYFTKIVKRHDLYIIENPYDTQFIQCVNYSDNRLIDEDTGEILCDDLTEDDMRKFDGDVEEPAELFKDTPAVDNEIIAKLKAVLGDTFIVR